MEYWKENSNEDEDDFLKKLYSKIEIEKIPKSNIKEVEEYVCGICGYRDERDNDIWYDKDNYNKNNLRYIKPDILYQMKFPLNVVIPIGLTNKDVLCKECKDWIDFIYKMQSRVGLHQPDELRYYEVERKEEQERYEKDVKEIIIRNEIRERQSEIIHELRKEIRKLNGSKTSPNKEKLKKELIEISEKISMWKNDRDAF